MNEIWNQISEKALGLGMRVLLAVGFFLIGVQLIKVIRKVVKKSMSRANAEIGAIQFADSFIKASLYVLLVMMLASSFGLDAASIVAVLGSAGVAIGLAVQGSLSNLAGGVLILALKPFKVGDYIKESYSGQEGTVTEIQILYQASDSRQPDGHSAQRQSGKQQSGKCHYAEEPQNGYQGEDFL